MDITTNVTGRQFHTGHGDHEAPSCRLPRGSRSGSLVEKATCRWPPALFPRIGETSEDRWIGCTGYWCKPRTWSCVRAGVGQTICGQGLWAASDPASVTERGVTPIALDITDPERPSQVAEQCRDVSVLVNNAEVMKASSFIGRYPEPGSCLARDANELLRHAEHVPGVRASARGQRWWRGGQHALGQQLLQRSPCCVLQCFQGRGNGP